VFGTIARGQESRRAPGGAAVQTPAEFPQAACPRYFYNV
jgi:hypothetical protein